MIPRLLVLSAMACRCGDVGFTPVTSGPIETSAPAPDPETATEPDTATVDTGACTLATPPAGDYGVSRSCGPHTTQSWDVQPGWTVSARRTPPEVRDVTIPPVLQRSGGVGYVASARNEELLRIAAASGTATEVASSIQAETPVCGGLLDANLPGYAVEWVLLADTHQLRSRDLTSLETVALGDPDVIGHNWTCSVADLDADGSFEVTAPSGSWRFPTLERLGVFVPPNPFPDATYRDTYGDFARPHDLNGTCHLLRPQQDGLFDPLTGEVEVPWVFAGERYFRSFSGSPVATDDGLVIWATDSSHGPGYFTEHERVMQLALDGTFRWADPFLGVDTPSIADADADGQPELCVTGEGGEVRLYEADGTVRWSLPSRGDSAIPEYYADATYADPQCVLADLDADGAFEAVLMDQRGLRILDGRTGATLAENTDYVLPGGRWWQAPIVADIDGDDSADIVVVGYDATSTDEVPEMFLVAFSAVDKSFARTRPVWNEYAYDVTSITSDGVLVSWPVQPWVAYNTYRAQPSFDGDHPDLVPHLVDLCIDDGVCTDDPTGTVRLSVQVDNLGSREQPDGARLRLFTRHHDTCFAEVASAPLPAIPSGWSTDAVVFEVDAADWGTRQVLEVWHDVPFLDPDRDCDLVNNRLPLDNPCDAP